MKKIILILIAIVLIVAAATKPDDKTCMKAAVKAVWGELTPNEKQEPEYYEQFMDINSQNVVIKNWILFKQIRYKLPEETRTVAIGAFKRIFKTVEPMEIKR